MAVTTTSGTTGIFNGYSILVFDGSSTLSTAHNTDYAYSTSGDFTIECWVKTSTTTANMAIVSKAASTFASKDFLIRSKGSTGVEVWIYDINSSAAALSSSTNIADGNWHHIALTRNSSGTNAGTHLMVDGAVTSITTSWDASNTNAFLWGDEPINDVKFTGNMADLRVSGRAQYTQTAVTETQTVDANWDDVEFLANGDSNTNDISGNSHTTTGGTSSDTVQQFSTNSISASQNQPGQYGTDGGFGIADNAVWDIGTTTPFCVEWWVYPTVAVGNYGVFNYGNIDIRSNEATNGYGMTRAAGRGAFTLPQNTWTHFALQREGSSDDVYLFRNGVHELTAASWNASTSSPILFGATNSGSTYQRFIGYFNDVRFTIGASRYSGNNWDVPTSALPTAATAQVTVHTYVQPTSPFGYGTETAAVPAYTPKFGNASALFDGDGDILTVASNAKFDLGAGDYTVEAWVKPDDLTDTVGTTTGTAGTGLLVNATLPTDLLAYYTMDNDWNDSTSNSYNGTATSATFSSTSKLGTYSGSFDGSDDKVKLPTAFVTDLNGSPAISISAWIKFSGTVNDGFIFEATHNNVNAMIEFRVKSGIITAAARSGSSDSWSGDTAGGTPSTSDWTHAVAVIDYANDTMTVYMNGSETATSTESQWGNSAIADVADSVHFGAQRDGSAAWFNGLMDEIGIWGKALTSTEVTALYNSGDGLAYGTASTISTTYNHRTANPVITIGDKLQVTSLSDGKGSVVVDGTAVISGITVLSDSTWRHVAVSRNSGSTRLFINGTQEGITYAGTEDIGQGEVRIGHNLAGADNQYFKGSMDEIRVTKGYSRYNANFTPLTREFGNTTPVATGDPYYDSVVLSLHMNGVDASTTFTDSSSTGHTVTAVGNAQIDTGSGTDNPKFGTARGLFDGTGDKLTVPSNTEFEMGTGDYTLEGWIKTDSTTSTTTSSSATPNWDETIFLLQSNTTTDGSTTFSGAGLGDQSGTVHSITGKGDVNHATAGARSGFWDSAIYFDGSVSGSDSNTQEVLVIAENASTDFTMGTDPFTIEFWFNKDAHTINNDNYIVDFRDLTIVDNWNSARVPQFWTSSSHEIRYQTVGNSYIISSAISLDTWYHIALVKDSSNVHTMYINGKSEGTWTNSDAYVATPSITVGDYFRHYNNDAYGIKGYINDLRITKGVALYSGTNTSTEWSNFSEITAKFPTTATISTSTTTTTAGGGGLLDFGGTGGNYPMMYVDTNTGASPAATSYVKYDIAGTNLITSTTNLDDDAWHHVAVSRQSTSTKMYINGVQEGSTAVDSPSATSLAQNGITIGEKPEITTTTSTASTLDTGLISFWNLDDSLVSVYHDSSGPYTFTNDSRTFSTTQKLLGTHSLGPKTASDQNGLYLSSGQNSSDWLDDTAFSVSYWIYRVDHVSTESVDFGFRKLGTNGDNNALYAYWYAGSGSPYYSVYTDNAYFQVDNTYNWGSNNGTAQWIHIVLTKDGSASSKFKVYHNGTLIPETEFYNDTNNSLTVTGSSQGEFIVGATNNHNTVSNKYIDEIGVWNKELTQAEVNLLYNSGTGLSPSASGFPATSTSTTVAAKGFNGKLDDWRITKGVARYTANFGLPVAQNFDITAAAGVPIGDSLYYSTGRVGIGNTNPGYTLDVTGSLNLTGNIYESGVQKSLGTTAVSLYADLPTATTDNRGQFYLVTSTNKMYWSNGATWVAVGSAIPSWTTYVATAGQTYTTAMGELDYHDGATPAGNVTHTAGASGAAGSGTPMATTTFLATDPALDVITYGIESVEVTTVGADDTTNSVGTISPKPTWISVASDGKLSITPDHTYKSDTLNIVGTASDGVNTLTKNFTFSLKGDWPAQDANWSNVKFLMDFNGDKVDESGTITTFLESDQPLETTIKKWGSGSLNCTNSETSTNLKYDQSFQYTAASLWTWEAWVYLETLTAKPTSQRAPAIIALGNIYVNFGIDNGVPHFFYTTQASAYPTVTHHQTMSTGQWYHVALSSDGTDIRIFLGGVVGTSTVAASGFHSDTWGSSNEIQIGQVDGWSGQTMLGGYLDDVRITEGVCRYTTTFNPPGGAFQTS